MKKNLDKIIIKGARQHNLKNVDVDIIRNKLVVITGLSGSGKSSLAFDTLYAEGQRRYVESLSSYARQFLGLMEKPDMDYIEGLSPAISIEQKSTARNPRSTVGTVTEIHDYLRLLFANVGKPHCWVCNKRIQKQTVQQIVDRACKFNKNSKLYILAPVVRGRKGQHKGVFGDVRRDGFLRLRVDGKTSYEMMENTRAEGFGKEVKRRILLGTYALSAGYYDEYYGKALQARKEMIEGFIKAFNEVDYLISPTTPTQAFKAGEKTNNPLEMYMSDLCTIPANLAGLPAISIPTGVTSDNLPLGVQVMSRALSDDSLLNFSEIIEKEVQFNQQPKGWM